MENVALKALAQLENVQKEGEGSWIYYRVSIIILLVFAVIVALWIYYSTVQFLRFVGWGKRMQIAFLLCLCLSATGKVGMIIREFVIRWDNCKNGLGVWEDVSLHWLNSTLFSVAITINIFNWIYQTLRLDKFKTGKRRTQWPYHLAFVLSVSLLFGVFAAIVLTSCLTADGHEGMAYNIVAFSFASSFLVLAITFAIVGINLYRKFRQVSHTQARLQKPRIFTSISVIFIWFMIKGILLLIFMADFNRDGVIIDWLAENQNYMALILMVYIIIVDFVPTLYQCLSIKWLTHDILKQSSLKLSKVKIKKMTTNFSDLDEYSVSQKEIMVQINESTSTTANDE